MVSAPQVARKATPVQQAPKPAVLTTVAEDPDFDIDDAGEEASGITFEIFETEKIAPPPIRRMGRGEGIKYPFEALKKVGHWFLLPPFAVDKEAAKKEKGRIASNVYKKHKDGAKFKLIQIDQGFAERVNKPELVGRYGVWRTA